MAQKKGGSSTGAMVAAGAGVVALSAAAYLIFGPEGKKHRKDLKSWMVKMKADVMEQMENVQEITGPVYENIVDQVKQKYQALGNVSVAELAAEADLLKKHWKMMQREAKAKLTAKSAKKAPAKAKAKPAAKKVATAKARA